MKKRTRVHFYETPYSWVKTYVYGQRLVRQLLYLSDQLLRPCISVIGSVHLCGFVQVFVGLQASIR